MTGVPALPMPVEDVELRGHLFIHHSYYLPATDCDRGELIEFHEEDHDGRVRILHPHTHKAPPEPEEWSWE